MSEIERGAIVLLLCVFAVFCLFMLCGFIWTIRNGLAMLRDAREIDVRVRPLAPRHLDPLNVRDPVAYQLFHAEDRDNAP